MKYVIIFLLSVSGVEEIKFETHGLNCSDMAQAWMVFIDIFITHNAHQF